MRVGFIGLGRMGLPMATNLVAAGHEVTGFDIAEEQLATFEDAGGTRAGSVGSAVEGAAVAITVLRTPEQVMDVADELLPAMDDGAVYADMSSIDPITAREIGERASGHAVRALDAPVSGGVVGAEAGTLAIMVGGEAADIETTRPLFDAMGGTVFHTGDLGTGQAVKLCNQIQVGGQCVLLAEAFRFGEAAGIDPQVLHDVLLESAGRGGVLEIKGEKLVERAFEPGFDIDLQAKDLRLALEAAEAYDVPVYAVAAVFQTFVEARRAGLGDRDHLGVYDLWDRGDG